MTRTRGEILMDILRCDREIESCIRAQQEHPEDKMFAAAGEMDWICARLGLEEELDALDKSLEQAA